MRCPRAGTSYPVDEPSKLPLLDLVSGFRGRRDSAASDQPHFRWLGESPTALVPICDFAHYLIPQLAATSILMQCDLALCTWFQRLARRRADQAQFGGGYA